MPAKVGESVNLALRLSLAAGDASGDLDKRLVSSASQVLTSKVEYVKSETFNSTILDTLKHKYLTLNTDSSSPIGNGRPGTPRLLPDAVANSPDMRPEPDSVLPTPKVILFPAERVQLGWRGNYPVGSGMLNVGNTCYLNATLQALFHIPSLVNWLQSDSNHLSKCTFTNGSVQTECLICAVNKTLKASHNKSGNVIKPYLIINRLKMICKHFSHGQQEDAHEFLRYLIENMGEAFLVRFRSENLDSYSKETTPLNQILGGYMRTEVTCLQCRGVSTTFQHFQELLLDIRRANTLDDALVGYFQRERLDGDDAYRCERCHRKVSATKKFSIEKPPHVLCIQLKRFSVVGAKLNKHVSFTQRLDLTRFLCSQSSRPLTYRLVSMVTHMGASVHCGHYTAIAQTSSGHFYQFDDSSVRPISLNAALDTNSYIIMYEMERQDSCPSQCTLPSPKPATVTSSSPLFNGTAPRSVSLPVVGSLPRPGPSTVTQIHKPSTLLPPAKERPASHCNGNAEEAKEESEEYEWVEKTQESLGLSRCNGQLNGWDNKDRGEVASHLARHSHQGYGPSVNSWTGGRAHVDREVENERREDRKRAFNKQYDDELDMGRVKKMKHRNDEFDENSHKTNRFDEYRKNWNNFRSSSSSSFYDSRRSGHQPFHNNKKYRNNHYNNGYYRRKFATQHHHQYYSNKQDRWRR
ncbi:ubiquitin carboxyl-terminal hydrolase 36 [Anabrus simplex]|uniref:ubiquitin carboxyl-terminal hydrolase 36 n=1 Tax=Anabrus simplex TaxID=316456 RepID=UPI0035A335FC